jgi:hypothetical protein
MGETNSRIDTGLAAQSSIAMKLDRLESNFSLVGERINKLEERVGPQPGGPKGH